MTPDHKMILYTRNWCGFCTLVTCTAATLGATIEERNIWQNRKWRQELIDGRGCATVPVLRRNCADGSSDWMPESGDIVRYLSEHYGKAGPPD